MELGNLPFGHGRGEYPVERAGEPCGLLADLMVALGIGSYGRLDETVARRMERAGFDPDWLKETDRGLDIHDPVSGVLLMRTRAYWWGDEEDPEAGKPNLEFPTLDFTLDWYKYMFRDSYSNLPLTVGLVNAMWALMRPATTLMIPYVPYPVRARCEWDEPAGGGLFCHAMSPDVSPEYDHGIISFDGMRDTGFKAEMRSRSENVSKVAYFNDLDQAKGWCERQMTEWRNRD